MGSKRRRVSRELVGDDSVFNLELVVVEVARSVIILCIILKTKQRRFKEKMKCGSRKVYKELNITSKFLISATRNDRFSIFCEEENFRRSRFQKGDFLTSFIFNF